MQELNRGGWGQALGRHIEGYSQARRVRVRETQAQIAAVTRLRIRDQVTAQHVLAGGLLPELQELARVRREHAAGRATDEDVRAAWVSVAATATLHAENADTPLEPAIDQPQLLAA